MVFSPVQNLSSLANS